MTVINFADSITTSVVEGKDNQFNFWQLCAHAHDFIHDFTTAGCGRDRLLKMAKNIASFAQHTLTLVATTFGAVGTVGGGSPHQSGGSRPSDVYITNKIKELIEENSSPGTNTNMAESFISILTNAKLTTSPFSDEYFEKVLDDFEAKPFLPTDFSPTEMTHFLFELSNFYDDNLFYLFGNLEGLGPSGSGADERDVDMPPLSPQNQAHKYMFKSLYKAFQVRITDNRLLAHEEGLTGGSDGREIAKAVEKIVVPFFMLQRNIVRYYYEFNKFDLNPLQLYTSTTVKNLCMLGLECHMVGIPIDRFQTLIDNALIETLPGVVPVTISSTPAAPTTAPLTLVPMKTITVSDAPFMDASGESPASGDSGADLDTSPSRSRLMAFQRTGTWPSTAAPSKPQPFYPSPLQNLTRTSSLGAMNGGTISTTWDPSTTPSPLDTSIDTFDANLLYSVNDVETADDPQALLLLDELRDIKRILVDELSNGKLNQDKVETPPPPSPSSSSSNKRRKKKEERGKKKEQEGEAMEQGGGTNPMDASSSSSSWPTATKNFDMLITQLRDNNSILSTEPNADTVCKTLQTVWYRLNRIPLITGTFSNKEAEILYDLLKAPSGSTPLLYQFLNGAAAAPPRILYPRRGYFDPLFDKMRNYNSPSATRRTWESTYMAVIIKFLEDANSILNNITNENYNKLQTKINALKQQQLVAEQQEAKRILKEQREQEREMAGESLGADATIAHNKIAMLIARGVMFNLKFYDADVKNILDNPGSIPFNTNAVFFKPNSTTGKRRRRDGGGVKMHGGWDGEAVFKEKSQSLLGLELYILSKFAYPNGNNEQRRFTNFSGQGLGQLDDALIKGIKDIFPSTTKIEDMGSYYAKMQSENTPGTQEHNNATDAMKLFNRLPFLKEKEPIIQNSVKLNNIVKTLKKYKTRFLYDNASNADTNLPTRPILDYVICSLSSIVDGMSLCSWNAIFESNKRRLELGEMNFTLENSTGANFYEVITKLKPKANFEGVENFDFDDDDMQKYAELEVAINVGLGEGRVYYKNVNVNLATGRELVAKVVYTNIINNLTTIWTTWFEDMAANPNPGEPYDVDQVWNCIGPSRSLGAGSTFSQIFELALSKSFGDISQELNTTFKFGGNVKVNYNDPAVIQQWDPNTGDGFRGGFSGDRPSGVRIGWSKIMDLFNIFETKIEGLSGPGRATTEIFTGSNALNTKSFGGYVDVKNNNIFCVANNVLMDAILIILSKKQHLLSSKLFDIIKPDGLPSTGGKSKKKRKKQKKRKKNTKKKRSYKKRKNKTIKKRRK